MRNQLVLLFGVLAVASSVVFIRESDAPPIMLAAWRCLLAALIIAPLALRSGELRPHALLDGLRQAAWPALWLAVHFVTWNIGARLIPAANATLLVSLVPLAMPVVLWAMLRERITRREGAATAIACIGLVILAMSDFDTDPAWLLGDAVCFGSMVLLTVYLAYSRKQDDGQSIWRYLLPLYTLAGLLCLLAGLLLEGGYWPRGGYPWLQVVGIAVVPMVIGHSILNWGMRVFSGQHVALVALLQFVFAGVLGLWLYGEVPNLAFALTSTAITLAAAWVIHASERVDA